MTSSIPYLIAKARSHVGASPSKQKIEMMINTPSMSEAENILSGYEFYQGALQQVRPSVDILGFEGILRNEFGKMLHRYSVGASPQAKSLLNAYAMRLEAENLQILFRAIIGGDHDEDILKFIVPVNEFEMRSYKRILNSTSPKNAVDFIAFPELRRGAARAFDKARDDDELVFYIVSSLEHAAFEYAYKFNKHIRSEVDLLNLETVARAISLKINPREWIIPKIGVVAQNIGRLERLSSPRDVIASMINSVPYSSYLRDVLNSPESSIISHLERQVDLALMKHHAFNFRIFSYSKEALFDFFALKYQEIKDIGKIFLGKANNIDPERIRNSLLYFAV